MTKDEKILQNWIPEGTIETRFFNYENMIAFAKHYAKLKEVPVPKVWEKWSEARTKTEFGRGLSDEEMR